MFGSRRRRAASNPPVNGSNASAAAMTAATSVFLKNQASNASLSSAAAAAALRSRPTTPTSVADVQTKRTLRRTASNSSVGSSVNGSQRGGAPPLQRRGSSGSMTERTFRDPSPARAVPSAPDAPPVPEIPQSHRRSMSLEAPAMRIASPPPKQSNGRGSSLGPGTSALSGKAARRASNLSSVSELTSINSRGSVNFSYPTSSRPQSPISQRRLTSPSPSRPNPPRITSPTNQNLIYDPNTRSFLPAAEILAIEQRISDAANKPVKKKKRVPPGNATGSHLAEGTVGGRLKGTAIDAMGAAKSQPAAQKPVESAPPPVQQKPVESKPIEQAKLAAIPASIEPTSVPADPPKRRKKKRVVVSDSDSDQASYVPNSSDNDSDIQPYNARAGALLGKKPSIVREDRQREEEEDDTPKMEKPNTLSLKSSPGVRDISPSPLPRSVAGRGHGRGQASASAAFTQERQQARTSSQPAPAPTTPQSDGLSANGSIRGARVQSVSPGRSAHFAPSPDSLIVKHLPPPRSISPRKSALKHTNSRTSSPTAPSGSEASNGSVVPEEVTSVPRKKSVRVSFDETHVVVGQAATPVTTDSPVASPQTGKRPWYSLGRGKRKEIPVTDDEEDEIMKPRPALPSFGSVRERKNREIEERPLVKPAEPIEKSTPFFTSPTGEILEDPLGQSNDHVVGAISAQDSSSRNAANISKSREPLPPQVTSVEGSGYNSDTDSSILDTGATTPIPITEPQVAKASVEGEEVDANKVVTEGSDEDTPTPTQEKVNGNVPEISVLQATPTLEEENKREWLSIPGGWESSTSDSGIESPRVSSEENVGSTPAASGIAEPTPEVQVHASPKIEAQHRHPIIMEETEESEADVYSDAAEELTDTEGDGFQSLNAVVESPLSSPITSNIPGLAISTPPESPTTMSNKEQAYKKSVLSKKSSEPELEEGWDKAQEYWKSLSDDKKQQLEIDAMREAEEEEPDTEVEQKPAPKPKKKKKVVQQLPPPIAIPNQRSYMIQPGSRAGPDGHTSMRSSMRAEPTSTPVDTQMRKSMRNQEPGVASGTMRTSMRGGPAPGSQKKKTRPVSLPAQPTPGGGHVRNLSAASAAAASNASRQDMQPPTPILRRRGSNDSDSSFKRAKPSNEMTMRRSMRGNNAQPTERPQSPASRFSLRSLSPTGSVVRRSFNSAPVQNDSGSIHMRMSMRGSQAPTPTLRGSAGRVKPPSGGMKMPAFARSSKPAKTQRPARTLMSRFADSSDEDDERPAFRSRFVDSSDDDDDEPVQRPAALGRTMRTSQTAPTLAPAPKMVSTPVRGIPKRNGIEDGDSSDLPDSDDEKPSSPGIKLQKRQNGTAVTNGAQGATLASGSLRRSGSGRNTINSPPVTDPSRPTHKRRGSFMSILRRKKDDSKVRKSEAESPARRDTPLERSKLELQALRSTSSPKLQKRNPLSRENSSSWPLAAPGTPTNASALPPSGKISDSPPKILGGENGRPFTADAGDGIVGGEALSGVNGVNGVNGVDRPDIGNRRSTATGLGAVDLKAGEGRKKKKFGALRRMFRLDG